MIIGIVIGVVVMAMLFLCVYIGYKLQSKPVKVAKTQQELEELKKREEGTKNILDYDYSIALGKRSENE